MDAQTQAAADAGRTSEATAERAGSAAERRAADRRRMQEAIEALRTSEGWQRWLRVRRHFHSYSFHNQLLIALQAPDATRVAGFKRWLALGYCVRKGERAIRVWAPRPPSKRRLREWREAGADPERKPRILFRLVPVFDSAQVEPLPDFPGEPVPLEPPSEPITGAGLVGHFAPLAAHAASLGLDVAIEPIVGAAAGFHEPATGRIVIDGSRPEATSNAQVATLIHELAHALVRIDRVDGDPQLAYAEEEVVVEAVAQCVCGSLGLDTAGSSVPYMAGWGERVNGEPIEAYAALIDRLASRIEKVIEEADESLDEVSSCGVARPT